LHCKYETDDHIYWKSSRISDSLAIPTTVLEFVILLNLKIDFVILTLTPDMLVQYFKRKLVYQESNSEEGFPNQHALEESIAQTTIIPQHDIH